MNQVTLVGRLVENPILEEINNSKRTIITLAISREYKNCNGVYETDFIKCALWNGIASSTTEYCCKGDVVGIRGRLQSNDKGMIVVADKITFISNGGTRE